VTKGDIYSLCQDLALRFGAGHTFLPLTRCEGGIAWEMWPGKEDYQHKSLRFFVNGKGEKSWPWVNSSWENSEDVAIQCDTDTIDGHRFKHRSVRIGCWAYKCAWTRKEWSIFKQCLKKYTS
jgi:hypothetical protein